MDHLGVRLRDGLQMDIAAEAMLLAQDAGGGIAAAIGESGAGIFPTLSPIPLAEAEKKGLDLATSVGYPSLSDLRK